METLFKNRIFVTTALSDDTKLILHHVLNEEIISRAEYFHIINFTEEKKICTLLDIVMQKGDKACHKLLKLLQSKHLQDTFHLQKLLTPDPTPGKSGTCTCFCSHF